MKKNKNIFRSYRQPGFASRGSAPKKSRRRLKLGAALIIVLVLALTGHLAYAHWHKTAPTNVASTQATATKPSSAPQASSTNPATTQAAAKSTPPTDSHCAGNTLVNFILVSISEQHLWACDKTSMVKNSAVTTGTTEIINGVDDHTPPGTYHIYAKETDQHLTGSDANGSWDDFVNYWMPFYGEYGFHDATWQTFPFGSAQYKTDGSHGCVHLPLTTATWIYDWAPIGTTVTVES